MAALLETAAREHGDAPFLTDIRSAEPRTHSYSELLAAATALHNKLERHRVSRGDRVAYLTSNSPFFYPLFFACSSRGAVLAPIREDLHQDEVRTMLKNASPKAVFHDTDLNGLDKAHPLPSDRWIPSTDGAENWESVDDILSIESRWIPEDCSENDEALIIYSSGTTNQSKGITLTHGNLCSMAETFVEVYGYQPRQRFLCLLPFYHINAPMLTGFACIRGRSHVTLSDRFGFTVAKFFWDIVADHGINVLSLTPSIMASLMEIFPKGSNRNLDHVEYALVGTAHLEENLWRAFEERFGIPCYQGYGLTETTAWATMTPPDSRKRYDSAGVPIGCELRIAPLSDTTTGERPTGEILIKGDIVMHGYNGKQSLTEEAIRNGWFRTGDLGYIDTDGQLVVTGRIKNIIKRKGTIIIPEEIDVAVRKHDGILECCTIGMPDSVFGEKVICAYVPRTAGSDLRSDLKTHLLESLSSYKCPDAFRAIAELPRNPVGKPDLRALRDLLSRERTAPAKSPGRSGCD